MLERLDYCVFQAPQAQACFDASLVLTAKDIDNAVLPVDEGWCVCVETLVATQALAELESYRLENLPTTIKPRPVVEFDSGWIGVLGYLLVIWAVPWLQAQGLPQHWHDAGSMQASLVQQGEWWRCFTALTLHGDLGHLMSNSVFGAGFGLLLGRYLGSGFGWLLIVCAGAFGNLLNASVRPDGFVSIGASTATFATIGLLGTFVWRRGYFRGVDWRRSFAPVFAAAALFAMLGVGDGPTDVVAHVMGFVCGALIGLVVPQFNVRRLGRSGQKLSGLLAVSLIAWSWHVALGG